jgi:hypothetical protein
VIKLQLDESLGDDNEAGHFDKEALVIKIDPNQPTGDLVTTLYHEILEVIWWRCSLYQCDIDPGLKEVIIDCFANGLYEASMQLDWQKMFESSGKKCTKDIRSRK